MITDFLEVIRLKTLWLKENIADYEQHLPWICFELKNVIYAWISRLIAEGKSKKALQTLYFDTIKDSHLEFLASTKFSAPKSFTSEDFQALLIQRGALLVAGGVTFDIVDLFKLLRAGMWAYTGFSKGF